MPGKTSAAGSSSKQCAGDVSGKVAVHAFPFHGARDQQVDPVFMLDLQNGLGWLSGLEANGVGAIESEIA